MEESPHKCPVCSRSFNQRSNLKTHLLTHTDHKPYECNSCGKVFRRNCDLRRHALTHAVGDVPPDVLAAEGFPPGTNPIDIQDRDSSSPRPRTPSLDRLERPPRDDSFTREVREVREVREHHHHQPRSLSPSTLSIPAGPIERTKCHHGEGSSSSSSSYSMRPQPMSDDIPSQSHPIQQSTHHPQLQIRRDLHQLKQPISSVTATITSNSQEPTFLGTFRRRIQEPPDIRHSPNIPNILSAPSTSGRRSPIPMMVIHPTNMSTNHSLKNNCLEMNMATSSSREDDPISSCGNDLSMKKDISATPTSTNTPSTSSAIPMGVNLLPVRPPPANPPKKTGFSIEDIMRR